MNRTVKRKFCKEYNTGYDSARELTLVLLDQYRTLTRYQSSESDRLETINDVQQVLDAIDMSYWRDDITSNQVLEMIQEIAKYLLILKSKSSGSTFSILEGKVNAALNRCIDVLVVA